MAHVFFQAYDKNIVLPPKVYFYEPQLLGFHIAGKRGSKYFKPENEAITDVKQRQQRIEADMHAGMTRADSAQQGSSLPTQTQTPQVNSKRNRANKSRHRGRKN